MTRRMVNAELFRNVELGECDMAVRLLYIGMIVHADDAGRMRAHPKYLRAAIFPFDLLDDEAMTKMRNRLEEHKLIIVYEVDGEAYLQHPKWEKWQILRKDRMKSSDCPSPRNHMATTCQPSDNQVPDKIKNSAAEPKLTEPNRTEPKTPLAPNPAKQASEPPMACHPWLIGLDLYNRDKKLMAKIWDVDKAWMKAFPGIDIGVEIKKAHAWELANPDRQKKNRIKFFNTWLSRAQDRPRMPTMGGTSNASNGGKSAVHDNDFARRVKEAQGLRKADFSGATGTLLDRIRNNQVSESSAEKPDGRPNSTHGQPVD